MGSLWYSYLDPSQSAHERNFQNGCLVGGWIEDIIIYVRFSSNYEMYRSLYDYTGKDKGVLPLRVGEKFRFIEQHDANWWKMRSQNGSVGLVPACYLEAVDRVSVRRTPFWYLACVIVKWLVCWQLFTIQFFRHFYLFGYVVENLNLVTSLFAFLKTCLAIYFTALYMQRFHTSSEIVCMNGADAKHAWIIRYWGCTEILPN